MTERIRDFTDLCTSAGADTFAVRKYIEENSLCAREITYAAYLLAQRLQSELARFVYKNRRAPKGDIVEGGGLSSLRNRATRLGGSMVVKSTPRFSLTIILPGEGGNQNG